MTSPGESNMISREQHELGKTAPCKPLLTSLQAEADCQSSLKLAGALAENVNDWSLPTEVSIMTEEIQVSIGLMSCSTWVSSFSVLRRKETPLVHFSDLS